MRATLSFRMGLVLLVASSLVGARPAVADEFPEFDEFHLVLLAPAQPEQLAKALAGVTRVIVVEQNHGAQLLRYLRSMYDLPGRPASFHRPGPLPLRPADLTSAILEWESASATERQPA